jgi:hypothetical protein
MDVSEELENIENVKKNEIELKAFYFMDSNQGQETSKYIYPVLLPSNNIIYIKQQIQKQQILIPLNIPLYYIHNNTFLKLWKDRKNNLLYNITSISLPLFSRIIFNEELFIIKISNDLYEGKITFNIKDNNILYKITLNDSFFIKIGKYLGSILTYALYILYIKPLS